MHGLVPVVCGWLFIYTRGSKQNVMIKVGRESSFSCQTRSLLKAQALLELRANLVYCSCPWAVTDARLGTNTNGEVVWGTEAKGCWLIL